MPYEPHDIPETVSILGISFVVGVIAQFLRQKTDPSTSNNNILWNSAASGFSAMITIGLLYEYSQISVPFLVGISGLAGWSGVSIITRLSNELLGWISAIMEKLTGVKPIPNILPIPPPIVGAPKKQEEEVNSEDAGTTTIGNQME